MSDGRLSMALIVELLTTADVPDQVRRIRRTTVMARTYPQGVTGEETRLLADLARMKLTDPPPPGIPATTLPALIAVLRREHPDLDDATVHVRARAIAHQALRARADALAATTPRSTP